MAKHKILVVDGSHLVRMAVDVVLSEAGYEVRTAKSRGELEEAIAGWCPDTILTDVEMRQLRGDQLCMQLKSRLDVRVILFSKIPMSELADLASKVGADGYISKLLGFALVRERLAEILKASAPEIAAPDE